MSRSQSLFQLQQLDTALDNAHKRIQEIELILQDRKDLTETEIIHKNMEAAHGESAKALKNAEQEVALQNTKLEQNQKKLYSGIITNPKELEDLQLESNALKKYLSVLEERQLETMLDFDQSRNDLSTARDRLTEITQNRENLHRSLNNEKKQLESEISTIEEQKLRYLDSEDLPDLPAYDSLRKASGGIAVTLMIDSSCSSCGANIPSAIEQEAKSPTKLAFCPTCKRILHPG